MKSYNFFRFLLLICTVFTVQNARAQSIHFSQYYNAPILLNPANAALMPDADFRIGAQHRAQWVAYPAPYNTTSIYGDFQLLRNKNQSNWLGMGFAFFNDNVGDGRLNLFRTDLVLAYHIMIGEKHMISAGSSINNGQRSVNFSKFSYPVQWDGYTFNRNDPNQEDKGLERSHYTSVSAGLNYAFFPNQDLYVKAGYSIANLNKPTETFFKGGTNTLKYRTTINIDALFKTSETVIFNPSAYYSTQSAAQELLFGSLVWINTNKAVDGMPADQLILGAFNRVNEAAIAVVGFKKNGLTLMGSYDYTISSLPINAGKGTGALEFCVKYESLYGENSKGRRLYHCPRF